MNILVKGRPVYGKETILMTVCVKCWARLKDTLLAPYQMIDASAEGCTISDHSAYIEGDVAICGLDGNAGFALLGENIQEGEAEFVEVPAPGGEYEKAYAMIAALDKLRDRLNMPNLPAKSLEAVASDSNLMKHARREIAFVGWDKPEIDFY